MANEKPYNDYITEECLDAIKTLDGADYGLKPKDVERVRALKARYNLDLPQGITGDLKSMSSSQKRDLAGYLAICNTIDLDEAYGDDSWYFFRAMEKYDRSALLTLIHHTGAKYWIDQYKQKDNDYSLLKSAKTGIREEMVKALICEKDGSLKQWPAKDEKKDLLYRELCAIKLMYDIGNDSFNSKESKDRTFNRWKNNDSLIEDISGCIKAIAEGELANIDKYENETETDWEAGPSSAISDIAQGESAVEQAQQPQQEEGMLSKLTKPIKKLFTNREENVNVAQGNQDINLQQSPSDAGGGPNQQLG